MALKATMSTIGIQSLMPMGLTNIVIYDCKIFQMLIFQEPNFLRLLGMVGLIQVAELGLTCISRTMEPITIWGCFMMKLTLNKPELLRYRLI